MDRPSTRAVPPPLRGRTHAPRCRRRRRARDARGDAHRALRARRVGARRGADRRAAAAREPHAGARGDPSHEQHRLARHAGHGPALCRADGEAKSRLQHGRDRDARPRDRRQHRHRQRGLCRAGEAAAVRAPRRDPQRADRDSGTPGAVREHSGVDSGVPGLARRTNGPDRRRRAPAVGVHPDRRRRTGARRRGARLEQLLRDARGARRARPRLLQRGGANRAGARGGDQRRAMAAALRRGSAARRPVDHDQRQCPRRRRHRATVAAGANRLAPARAAAIRAARRHLEAPRSHTGRARRRELGPRRARAGAGRRERRAGQAAARGVVAGIDPGKRARCDHEAAGRAGACARDLRRTFPSSAPPDPGSVRRCCFLRRASVSPTCFWRVPLHERPSSQPASRSARAGPGWSPSRSSKRWC